MNKKSYFNIIPILNKSFDTRNYHRVANFSVHHIISFARGVNLVHELIGFEDELRENDMNNLILMN